MSEHIGLDKTGVSLSVLCLIHCLTGPLLIAFLPTVHTVTDETFFHGLLGPVLVIVAAFALIRGYRQHRKPQILVLGLVGVGFLALGMLAPHEDLFGHYSVQMALTSIASIFLISAHIWNIRSCRCDHSHEH